MRSISENRRKSNKFGWVMVAIMFLACVVAAVVLMAQKGVINIKGITPEPPAPQDIRVVAYVSEAYGAGTDALDAISYYTYDANEGKTLVPDDILTEAEVQAGEVDGYVLKEDVVANTFVTRSMLCPLDTENLYNDTTRQVTVSFIDLTNGIEEGDFVDVRFRVSSEMGETALRDDIVLAKKQVLARSGNVLTLPLDEDEQLLLAAAGVERTIYLNQRNISDEERRTATLYVTEYMGLAQPAAKVTYSNDLVVDMIRKDINLIDNPTALYEAIVGEVETTQPEEALEQTETPVVEELPEGTESSMESVDETA